MNVIVPVTVTVMIIMNVIVPVTVTVMIIMNVIVPVTVTVMIIMNVIVPVTVTVVIFIICIVAIRPPSYRLGGLVVKASASRAEDPGFESRWRRDFVGVESYQ